MNEPPSSSLLPPPAKDIYLLQRRAEDEALLAQSALEQRTAQLLAANEELQAFSYAVAHDLRAPLRHVIGFLELLRREAGASLSPASMRHMDTIATAARRMAQLIEGLLAFSRLGRAELHKTNVSLADLVSECQREFQVATQARNILWSVHRLPSRVHADRALLLQVLRSLCSNAVKFTGPCTEPRIEIGCAYGDDGERVIYVRDNGVGFDPRYIGKLFGVFQRLHSQDEFEGTGISLANAQRIVHKHGGRIWADGVVDGGACFYFSIPSHTGADTQRLWVGGGDLLPRGKTQTVAIHTDPAPSLRSAAVSLLLVEDSEADAQLLLTQLEADGLRTLHRRVQSIAALEIALATERWDAVISDYRLPSMTGMEALGIVRATGLDLPFILVSGTIGEELAVAAMKAGASDYIMKSSLQRLAPALERELHEARLRSVHRASERDLVESEERFRGVTSLSSDWYWEQDETLYFTFTSHALRDRYRQTLESWAGPARWTGPYLAEEWSEHRARVEAQLPFDDAELEPFLVDGRLVYISVSGKPRFDAGGTFRGYRGVGTDITERVRSVDELRRFHTAMDNIPDAIFFIDRASMCFVHVNDASCRLRNMTREQLMAMDPWNLWGKQHPILRADLESLYDGIIARGGQPESQEFLWRPAGTAPVWLEIRRHAQRVRGRWTVIVLLRDITERKAAEHDLRRLNRIYAMVSAINALVARARERDDLFSNACRIAVEQGEFDSAWIGLVQGSPSALVPLAAAGMDTQSVTAIKQLFACSAGALDGNTLAVRAMREKTALVSNDVSDDPVFPLGKPSGLSDIQSVAVFPLLNDEAAVGVLVLLTSQREFLDPQGLQLVTELAGNIAFAMAYLDKQARLDYLAYYDTSTGLANRRLFLDRLAQYVRAAEGGKHELALFLVDLERFRSINDSLGRPAGDSLLRQVGQWLQQFAGDPNLVARVGTDQFAVVLPELRGEGAMLRLLEKGISAFLNHPFRLNEVEYRIAAKIGVVLFPDDGADADTLLKHAEAAVKKAKVSGDRYLFFAQKMSDTFAGRLGIENQLRQALDREEFVLHYQPKFNLVDGRLTGAEALIRWSRPEVGLVPPAEFIPILEQTGLIHEVGRWALRSALREYQRWLAAGRPPVRIAVNVSPLQLRSRGFVAEVAQAVGDDPNAAAALELEITESLIMEDVTHSIASLQAIRAMGLSIAIDDFGTGFSSLSYLSKLPVDTLKIDRSFVHDMSDGREGVALVSVIINLAHALKLNVVAEGVETTEQLTQLRALNCDEMQGFLSGRPVPGELFESTYLNVPHVDLAQARISQTQA